MKLNAQIKSNKDNPNDRRSQQWQSTDRDPVKSARVSREANAISRNMAKVGTFAIFRTYDQIRPYCSGI